MRRYGDAANGRVAEKPPSHPSNSRLPVHPQNLSATSSLNKHGKMVNRPLSMPTERYVCIADRRGKIAKISQGGCKKEPGVGYRERGGGGGHSKRVDCTLRRGKQPGGPHKCRNCPRRRAGTGPAQRSGFATLCLHGAFPVIVGQSMPLLRRGLFEAGIILPAVGAGAAVLSSVTQVREPATREKPGKARSVSATRRIISSMYTCHPSAL